MRVGRDVEGIRDNGTSARRIPGDECFVLGRILQGAIGPKQSIEQLVLLLLGVRDGGRHGQNEHA